MHQILLSDLHYSSVFQVVQVNSVEHYDFLLRLIDKYRQKKKDICLCKPEACNFTKSITPPWVFFIFLKLFK